MANPFDDNPIGSRYRELYGEYRSMYSKQKVGSHAYHLGMPADGTNWVKVSPWSAGGDGDLKPTVYDIAIYQVIMYKSGGANAWAGEAGWRLTVDDVKVYPFLNSATVVDGNTVYLGTLSTMVRTGEVCDLQFISSDAGDNAGQWLFAQVMYAELRGV